MTNEHMSSISGRRITMERTEDGYLKPWQCEQELKGVYRCSFWWKSFNGGEACINSDGSVSYEESHDVLGSSNDSQADIHAFLAYDKNKKAFIISEKPDYEAANYLPIKKPHKRRIQKRKAMQCYDKSKLTNQ